MHILSVVTLVNFFAFFAIGQLLGGYPIYGGFVDGHYYLARSLYTERHQVSETIFTYATIHQTTIIPMGLLLVIAGFISHRIRANKQ